MKELCNIIEKAHKIGLYHRDLKPDNIIISDLTKKPVIIDFGICWLQEDESFKTKKGIELGNRFLRLPELSKGTDVTVSASDITFLVGLMFFLILRKQPHILLNENGEMPHQRDEFKSQNVLKNKKVKQIFDKGFTYEVALRYQTPDELKIDINEINTVMEKSNKKDIALEKLDEVFNNDFYKKKMSNIEIIKKH
jgi:serine/threonine-protein kinase